MSPDSIITFMYDDIAFHEENPLKGQLYNSKDGPDVYQGVKIDYKGDDVTPEMFAKVMTELKPSDKVFVYFSDHGAPGLLAFPSGYLYADELQAIIATMQQKQLFNRMIIYVEACESGSLFHNVTNNVFAMTASNSTSSSWAAYCSPEDTVNGTSIGACLADEFSANWMDDSSTDFISQTLTV